MTIKIEIPSDNKTLAAAIGAALTQYAGGATAPIADNAPIGGGFSPEHTTAPATQEEQAANLKANAEAVVADKGNDPAPATSDASAAGASSGGATKADNKGVGFNAEYCGKAEIPFYGSGKKKGQWKKKVGVDQDVYDEWYAGELLKANISDAGGESDEPEEFDAGSTFGGGAAKTENKAVMKDGGELMGWASEMQAAGRLDQSQIDATYQALGLGINDLFGPDGQDAAQQMYDALSALV